MNVSDIERAIAALATQYQLLSPETAYQLITTNRERGGNGKTLTNTLRTQTSETQLLTTVAQALRFGFVDLHAPETRWRPAETHIQTIGLQTLIQHRILPVEDDTGNLAIVAANPRTEAETVAWVQQAISPKDRLPILIAHGDHITARLVALTSTDFDNLDLPDIEEEPSPPPTVPTTATSNNPVVEFVDNLLSRAISEGASDVHFLTQADNSLLIRFRVDGHMRRQSMPLRGREREVIGTILSKCGDNLDASDRTRPQDGTFSFTAPTGRTIDARLGMLPQAHGPTIVIRLLDPHNINRRLEDMGFSTTTLTQMRRVLRNPQGAVFFIGPTGSGKTTTLYSLLKELPAQDMSILTAEDPVEYRLPFIGQTQIRTDLGEKSLTFAKALRSMLRLDPDVILVGEVRDNETAETAMQAALTGHMVLSTLHAKTAVATYQRLGELGVDPYLSSEAVSLAVNQRLVRTLHNCATVAPPTDHDKRTLDKLNLPIPTEVAHAREHGCVGCYNTGYLGRLAVVETMEPSEEVKELVASRASRQAISNAATADGYTSVVRDAYRHVENHTITVRELLHVDGVGEG